MMRIFITTMDDPLVTNNFIKRVIGLIKKSKDYEIIGLAVSKYGQTRTRNFKQKISFIIALIIITGLKESLRNIFMYLNFKIRKSLSKYFNIKSTSIIEYAKQQGIPVWEVDSVNSPKLLKILDELKPDIIINQAQEILRKDFLNKAKIGVLNRHNSLLPKYRGRLAPFWALYYNEKYTGVTIHFVTPKVDAGPIIVQKIIKIEPKDTYVSLTRKCYEIAPKAMYEAIEKIKNGERPMDINIKEGSYHSLPGIKEALEYLKRRRGLK